MTCSYEPYLRDADAEWYYEPILSRCALLLLHIIHILVHCLQSNNPAWNQYNLILNEVND